jgi:hypothetical protein
LHIPGGNLKENNNKSMGDTNNKKERKVIPGKVWRRMGLFGGSGGAEGG